MSVCLLDLNVLLALAWPSHVHHAAAHVWFESRRAASWATCAITQCGFVRISSNPSMIDYAVTPKAAITQLSEMVKIGRHVFWGSNLAIYDSGVPSELLAGHNQVTDAWLLGLALKEQGKLATMDRRLHSLLARAQHHAVELVPTT